MEIAFEKKTISWLDTVQSQVQNLEVTQELRVPDGMPDAARVLGCWGQPTVRSKEWYGDSFAASGGVMTWVLYQTETGAVQGLDVWIPFQTRWALPEDCRDGTVSVAAQLRFLDGRSASPRKLSFRAGLALLGEAMCFRDGELYAPRSGNETVELLREKTSVRLWKEAGEKRFTLEENLPRPTGAERLLACTVTPQTEEARVLGDKLAMRGTGNLHAVLQTSDGRIFSRDEPLAFSGLAELEAEYGSEAGVCIRWCVSNVEAELGENGMTVRCSFAAQYRIDDTETVETVTDAYCPGYLAELTKTELALPAILDRRAETVTREDTLSVAVRDLADVTVFRDCPKLRRGGSGWELAVPVGVQVLYYDPEGKLQTASGRWESSLPLNCAEDVRVDSWVRGVTPVRTAAGDTLRIQTALTQEQCFRTGTGFPMVTGVTVGEAKEKGEEPSLILCRAEKRSLWELGKAYGARVSEIQSLNRLEGEPNPRQLLLIPSA